MVVPREQLGGLRLAVVRARGGQASKQKQQMPDTATAPTDMNNKLTEIACTKKKWQKCWRRDEESRSVYARQSQCGVRQKKKNK